MEKTAAEMEKTAVEMEKTAAEMEIKWERTDHGYRLAQS
jgi:hypothetical protein